MSRGGKWTAGLQSSATPISYTPPVCPGWLTVRIPVALPLCSRVNEVFNYTRVWCDRGIVCLGAAGVHVWLWWLPYLEVTPGLVFTGVMSPSRDCRWLSHSTWCCTRLCYLIVVARANTHTYTHRTCQNKVRSHDVWVQTLLMTKMSSICFCSFVMYKTNICLPLIFFSFKTISVEGFYRTDLTINPQTVTAGGGVETGWRQRPELPPSAHLAAPQNQGR